MAKYRKKPVVIDAFQLFIESLDLQHAVIKEDEE